MWRALKKLTPNNMENNNFEQRILTLEERVKKLEDFLFNSNNEISPLQNIQKKMSIKEFLMTKQLDDEVKRTLAISYFLEILDGVKPFNTDDLKKAFRLAKVQLPKNVNDKINMNIKKGHIMEAEEKKAAKKAWELTASGERFVENELNNAD